MLAPTHMAGGQFAYLLMAWWTGHEPHLGEAVLAGGAALLPDVDHRSGLVGRWVPWLSGPLEHWAGHRTVTHSLVLTLVVCALAVWLLPSGLGLAVAAGFASHALLDMMTPSGVAWFWPARARCVLPGHPRWRMEPMGRGELAFLVVVAVLTWPTLLAAERGVGLLGTVRDTIGSVTEARRHYDAHRSESAWWLDVQGEDNRAFRPVEGRYRIIGPYRAAGLILETPEGPRSVCRADACDWYARRAVLDRGRAERTTVRELTAERTSVAALRAALEPLTAAGRVYLLGELEGEGLRSRPPVAESGTGGLNLRYAPLSTFEGMDGRVDWADLLVQVRHPPGAEVPWPSSVVSRESAVIDPRLRRYLP
ncbi:metal-dependent hydrolase [Aquisalimonas sp. 2447]|uniref:metal-dependent hydrolase n=1 Tax=Aquisalimonas sp. 2447 TaxID=2740807 RepID=UPI00143249E4|nr:metal-dependent hydrolase [Aquisalimonas sp. 2447]QIT54110.1 metal-dependent hydrolase [Aquisalimonas sp. 2447]